MAAPLRDRFRVMGSVLQFQLGEEIEAPELFSQEQPEMILLKGVVGLGPVVEEPEVRVPVEVDLAQQGLPHRVHRVLLRLGFLLEIVLGRRPALPPLQLADPLEKLGDGRLLGGQLGPERRDVVLLRPRGPGEGDEYDGRQGENALHRLLLLLLQPFAAGQAAASQSYRPLGPGLQGGWVN